MSEHAIKEEEEPLPKEIQRVPVEEPLWDEDLPEETVSLADLEEEKRAAEKATETPIYNSGKAEYEEKSHINDEKKPQTQRGFEQSEDWEEITEEPEESPWDPKLDESVSPDPLAAASGSIYVPEEKKQIVTASGKVIEAEAEHVGFREIYKVNINDAEQEQMQITGQKIIFRGVNRHDTSLGKRQCRDKSGDHR